MRRNIELKPEYILIAYLIGVVISYGHSYWKFNPCDNERGPRISTGLLR